MILVVYLVLGYFNRSERKRLVGLKQKSAKIRQFQQTHEVPRFSAELFFQATATMDDLLYHCPPVAGQAVEICNRCL